MTGVFDTDVGELLIVLLDCTCSLWHATETETGPQSIIEQLLVFLNCVSFTSTLNKLVVLAVGSRRSYLLSPATHSHDINKLSCFNVGQILRNLRIVSLREQESGLQRGCILSSGLSRALCHAQHFMRQSSGPGCGRLLCLSSSQDDPRQYISVMNAIFSAQRSSISIDCCNLGSGHSVYMQQAGHLTGGVYVHPPSSDVMLQYLLYGHASGPPSRKLLRLPKPATIDFRASCFCHKRSIDIGFVCSVCLSIFCEKLPSCITCGSDFEMTAK